MQKLMSIHIFLYPESGVWRHTPRMQGWVCLTAKAGLRFQCSPFSDIFFSDAQVCGDTHLFALVRFVALQNAWLFLIKKPGDAKVYVYTIIPMSGEWCVRTHSTDAETHTTDAGCACGQSLK